MSKFLKIDSLGNKISLDSEGERTLVTVPIVSTVLTGNDSGGVFGMGTAAKAFTLPAIAVCGSGVEYTFVNTGADAANIITVSPAAADSIHGTITLAGTVVVLSGVADKAVINTAATATTGDSIKLVSTPIGWVALSSTGIWASQG